jgi:hypothetical protein
VEEASKEVETALVDLSEFSLSRLRASDRERFAPSVARLLSQVARARRNLTTNPPGRVD